MSRSFPKALGILLLFAATRAYADEVTAVDIFKNLYSSFFSPLNAFGESLTGGGKVLLIALVTLHIAYGGVLVAAGTMDLFTLAMNGVKLSLIASLLWAALAPQAWLGQATGINAPVTLSAVIVRGFQTMVATAAEAGSKNMSADSARMFNDIKEMPQAGNTDIASANMFGSVFTAMFKTLKKIIDVPLWPESKKGEAGMEKFKFWKWGDKLGELTADFITFVIGTVFWIGTIFMYLLACGVLILELLGSVLTVGIALAFTPLMVPWLLFQPLAFLFNNWLKLLLIGSLGFVIGVLMLSGFGAFMDAGTKTLTDIAATPEKFSSGVTIAWTFLPIFLGSFIFMLLVPKATGLASSLISGMAISGVSAKDFGRSMAATGAVAGAPSQAARQIAGGAKAGGNMALQGAQAAIGGIAAGVGMAKAAPGAVAGGIAAGTSAAAGAMGAAKSGVQGAKAAFAQGGVAGVVKAGTDSAVGGLKSAASGAVGAAKAGVEAVKNKDTAGMAAAKAVAKAGGLAPNQQQLASAASASNRAINTARMGGMDKNAVTKAGNQAAKEALTGADKPPKPAKLATPETPTPSPAPNDPSRSV